MIRGLWIVDRNPQSSRPADRGCLEELGVGRWDFELPVLSLYLNVYLNVTINV